MGKSNQPYLRSENGKREAANELHLRFNKNLQCPACDFECSTHGAFTKDSGVTPDESGCLYRRFKCRDCKRCHKALAVSELLAMCKMLSSLPSFDQVCMHSSSGRCSSTFFSISINLRFIFFILLYSSRSIIESFA